MFFCFTSKHINLSLHDSYKVSHLLLDLKKYMYFVRRKINLFHGTDIVIEPSHGKTKNLHRRKQRRRSASR